ncbi:hypothetical protein JCM16418A_11960 [Paenibacillus pini]|uniref:Uncharacterized protein n=1 Tax=Paenibacillus pini JCM 16418 TaxID=1236976 RepID=W7YZI3_9BACL|nr:hypothetical protein JCM16418_1817 [Paenibacillus pini JCM 16418]
MFNPLHKRLYFGLFIPFGVISVISVSILPDDERYLIIGIPLLFWIIYYICIYFINRKPEK